MRPLLLQLAFILFCALPVIQCQEWKLFSASDAVQDFKIYDDQLWVSSGSGLTKIDLTTHDKTTWNIINSDMPDYSYNKMAIDSNGTVWLGMENELFIKIALFDGQSFETIHDINGNEVHHDLDIEVTPNGTVWLLASVSPKTLYSYEQSQFIEIPLPAGPYEYPKNFICAGLDNHVWAIITDVDLSKYYLGEYDGQEWVLHDLSSFNPSVNNANSMAIDKEGNLYVFCKTYGTTSLLKYNGQTWLEIPLPVSVPESEYVENALIIDDQNRLKILLSNNSFVQYDGVQWSTVDLSTIGFSSGQAENILVDEHSEWWVIHTEINPFYNSSKLYKYDGVSTELIDLSNSGLSSNNLYRINIDENNNKWLQSRHGMIKYNGAEWTYIKFPEEFNLSHIIGSDHTGGQWIVTHSPSFANFDGVTFQIIPFLSDQGVPVEDDITIEADAQGRILASAWDSRIMVFDHGEVTYLNQTYQHTNPDIKDSPWDFAYGPDGRLYAIGVKVHRLEADSTWSVIPLWDNSAVGVFLTIGPDTSIWTPDFTFFDPDYIRLRVYDGSEWSIFDSPVLLKSLPKWDLMDNAWFMTDQGLCKYANQTWTCYNRANSPIISERLREFIIDEFNNIWIIQEGGGLLLFNEVAIEFVNGKDLPKVSGHVYRDLNQNGIFDAEDTPLAYQRELMLPDNIVTFSHFDGNYSMKAINGDHEVQYVPRPNWHIDNTPSSYEIQVADQSISNLDFALAPDQEKVDLSLFLVEGFPRCNTISTYALSYTNWGTMAEDVVVTLILDPNVSIANAQPQPDFVAGDTLSWFASDLLPFASAQIRLNLNLPGVEQTIISYRGYIDRIVNEVHERIDSILVTQEIRCSFDPNDKLARTTRGNGDGQSLITDLIYYTIRFQNTGNDTAFQIVIRDTLDPNLDLTTLEIISASHPYEAFLKPDRTLEFIFHDIHLPDSTINELESHGFVTYRIKAKADIPSPTLIENTAHIYFDYNGSIQTNTAVNELVDFLTSSYNEKTFKLLLSAYPNPVENELIIKSITNELSSIQYYLSGIDGKPVLSGAILPGETQTLLISSLPPGLYVLHANTGTMKGSVVVVKGK